MKSARYRSSALSGISRITKLPVALSDSALPWRQSFVECRSPSCFANCFAIPCALAPDALWHRVAVDLRGVHDVGINDNSTVKTAQSPWWQG